MIDTFTWCWGSVSILLWRNREARTCQESHEAHSATVSDDDEVCRNFIICEDQFQQSEPTAITHFTAAWIQLIERVRKHTWSPEFFYSHDASQTSCVMITYEDTAAQLRCKEVIILKVIWSRQQLSVKSVFFYCRPDHTSHV